MQTYTQCTLEKYNNCGGRTTQTSFIPSKFAVLDSIVRLKDACGIWEDGWLVISVGATVDEDFLPDSHKAIKEHRKKTGDSLPKK